MSRFKELAYCGSFRDDGRLLIAGSAEGQVRLFDVDTKTVLRIFKGHKGAVHVSRFLSNGSQILSGSDDNSTCIWDIPTEKPIITYNEHKVSGNTVKIWDALAGGKLITSLTHHHKTVTCLGFCSNYQRLLSGGLDRHVKIYDVGTYQVVHTLDYPGAILSLGVSPDDSLLAVGTAEGLLSLQRRKSDEVVMVTKKKRPVSYRYGLRGKTYLPNKEDHVVEHTRKEKLAQYDKHLKNFAYTRALDVALHIKVRKSSPDVTFSVLQELIRRDGIRTAIAGREGSSLRSLVYFIVKNISNPRYISTLIDLANLILDMYQSQVGRSSDLDDVLSKLKVAVEHEMAYMKLLYKVMGSMDTLFSASHHTHLTNNMTLTGSHDQTQLTLKPSLTATAS